ncbi:MAG: hypothetical protein JNL70_14040 [Saprospiraceae bacterium]|nr:hypothetical protein [Saprospiraceae bacterium]
MEEKDLFDLFREESENLVEQPKAETWQRLEKRLASSRTRRQRRKPVPTQWLVVAVLVALFAIMGVGSWFVTRDHELLLRGQKQFADLQFLIGSWSASEGGVGDELVFEPKNKNILRGVKTVKFKDVLVKRDTFVIENKGKNNAFLYQNQSYILKNTSENVFTFQATDGSVIRLRQSLDNRFTVSFGAGAVFLYRRM